MRLRAGVLAVVCALATGVIAGAAPSYAATASVAVDGRWVIFQDNAGETNTVTVARSGAEGITVTDSTTPITAGSGCTQNTPNQVSCTATGLQAVSIRLGGGNDSVETTGPWNTVFPQFQADGGAGDDVITATDAPDVVKGGGGADRIYAGAGNDILEDGDGAGDGAGPDTLDGGPDNDIVRYTDRGSSDPLTLDLASPVDGQDEIARVETIQTGPAADTLSGDGGPNDFYGGGRDVLRGRGGDDRLTTDRGGRVDAGGGQDGVTVTAAGGDSATPVACGPGHDYAQAWPTDTVNRDCEHATVGGAVLAIEGMEDVKMRLLRKGTLRFGAACAQSDPAAGCSGRIRLLRKNGSLASTGRYEVNEDYGRADFKLSRADRRRLARGHLFTFEAKKPGKRGFRMLLET